MLDLRRPRTSARGSLSSCRASCFFMTSPPRLPPAAAIRALTDSGFPSARTDGARNPTFQAETLALGRAVSVRSPSSRPLGFALGAPNACKVLALGWWQLSRRGDTSGPIRLLTGDGDGLCLPLFRARWSPHSAGASGGEGTATMRLANALPHLWS